MEDKMLESLKDWLGITDTEQDAALTETLSACQSIALAYCRRKEACEGLCRVIVMMAVKMWRTSAHGTAEAVMPVKSVSEGDRNVSFDTGTAVFDASEFYALLEPFRRRCGRTPSAITEAGCCDD